MKIKKNKISFHPTNSLNKEWSKEPVPAKKYLPNWYKCMDLYVDKEASGIEKHELTLKSCQPFLDSISSGYYILLNSDVVVSLDKNGNHVIEWKTDTEIVSTHLESQVKGIDISNEYRKFPFKWNNFFVIKTPKNYSTLFTHPLGINDLPFYSLPGVVDTDKFNLPINFPFFIKKDFQGIIKRGTPIIQVIPFKRDAWYMEMGKIDENIEAKQTIFLSNIKNYYKNFFWSRKEYR